jgi:hypothetical protein
MVKRPLRKTVRGALITFDEFEVLLCQLERAVNSRPLTVPSSDAFDEPPITPLALTGKVLSDEFLAESLNVQQLTRRQRYIHRLQKTVVRRWNDEYLVGLSQRKLHLESSNSLRVGQLVYVENGKLRCEWPLARIVEIVPGSDGVVRLVKLKIGKSEFFRPVQRLIPLELDVDSVRVADSDGGDVQELPLVKPVEKERDESPVYITRYGRTVKKPERF